MIIYDNISDLKKSKDLFLVNIGNYDGVHQGHQQLIKYLKQQATDLGLKLCLFTFKPHPRIFFDGIHNFLISTDRQKTNKLEKLGVDGLFVLDFNQVSKLSSDDFLSNYIKDVKGIKALFLGYDFRFGKDKKGDFISANDFFKDSNLVLEKSPSFKFDGDVVSSTLIREKIAMGEMEIANKFLGEPFELEGKVIEGKGKGKQIGIPTANLEVHDDYIIPKKGVYCTKVKIDNQDYFGITNIGINPTFGKLHKSSIETHIFGLDQDIYGHKMELSFFKYLRSEKKFSSVDDLISQIKKDISWAKKFWNYD